MIQPVLIAIGLLSASKLLVFCLCLLARRRWRIPVADLERLVRVCFPRRLGVDLPPDLRPGAADSKP